MILREATIRYKGYDPDELTKGSHKRVCYVCDSCSKVNYTEFRIYKIGLCRSCLNIKKWDKGIYKNVSLSKINKSRSIETKQKISNSLIGKHHSEKNKKMMSNMNALALRLGKLQAHVIRLDALGSNVKSK